MATYNFLKKKNNSQSTLNGNILSSSSTVTLTSAASFPATVPFVCTIWNATSFPDPSSDPTMEIVSVTSIAGNVFTITRAQEGTVAAAHSTGHAIQLLMTAGQIVELETQINTRASIYRLSFTNANLSGGVLTVNHNLGQQVVNTQVFDNTNALIVPDNIILSGPNTLTVTLTSFGTITGTYNLIITG